ncbi:MAG TPA: hypothetical protein EYP40_09565, partial [Chromatiales bacterium]|nr:hypothetical protein [Chromatiales bacterium]
LLRYELLIWNDGRLQHRLGNLGFHHSHPRFGGHLPTDSELFRLQEGRAAALNADATDAFFEEVKSPRFPLAGPQDNALDWFYLPVGMPFTAAFEFAQEPVNAAGNREPVDKSRWNGLARFDSALFIDQALNWADTGSLLAQAEQRAYLGNAPRALRGIHSLFAIDEITLIAVPDAIHRRWTRMPPPVKPPLAAPFLETIETKRASGKIELRWDAIDEATGYIVEQDSSAAFDRPVSYLVRGRSVPRVGEPLELMPAADNFLTIPWPSGCPASYYFRVRAERHGEVSAWSNTRARLLPPTEFLECELSQPGSLELKLALDTTDASRGLVRLSWTGADAANGEPMSVDRFQVEQAKDIEFHSAHRIFSSPEQSLDVQQPTDANFYFRVRGQRG